MSTQDATTMIHDQLTERGSQGQFIITWAIDTPRKAKNFQSRAFFSAYALVPGCTAADDQRHIGKGFDVIDNCRFAIYTHCGWEWRTQAGLPQISLDRFQQGRS